MKFLSFLDVKDLAKLLYTTHQIFIGGFEMNLHSSDGEDMYTCEMTAKVEGILRNTGNDARVFIKRGTGSTLYMYANKVLVALIEIDSADNEIVDIFPETWFINKYGLLPLLPYLGQAVIFDKEV